MKRQMSVYFETVIQSTPMAEFSFGFTAVKRPKHVRSVAEDLISKQELNEFVKNS